MTRITLVLLAGASLLPQLAFAGCSEPYDTMQLLGDMGTVEEGLRSGEDVGVAAAGRAMASGLACIEEIVNVGISGRVFRAIAASKLVGSDEGAARQWFATSLEVDSVFDYGLEDLKADSAVRELFLDVKNQYVPEATPVEGKSFIEGVFYLDGRRVSSPSAVGSRPHLLQVKDTTTGVRSWVIQGNAFPDDLLFDPSALVVNDGAKKVKKEKKPKKEKTQKVAKSPQRKVDENGFDVRQRPPEKTPLLVGGVALVVGAVAAYGYSFNTVSQFKAAKTEGEVNAAVKLNHNVLIISGSLVAVGAASLGWGMAVNQGVIMPTFRMTF